MTDFPTPAFPFRQDSEDDGPAAPPAPSGVTPVSFDDMSLSSGPVAPPRPATPGLTPPTRPATPGMAMPVAPPSTPSTTPGLAPAPAAPAAPVAPTPGLAPAPAMSPTPGLAPAPTAPARRSDGPAAAPAASAPGVETVEAEEERIQIDELLLHMVEAGGSDLHLSAGSPPVIRVRGEITPIPDVAPLTATVLEKTMYSIMNSKQRKTFEENWELDFAYVVPGQARFRVNVLKQRGSVGAVMRTIPWEIKSLEALGLPEVINTFADLPRGFVLVTGPTGSGKSTTLASIIDKANRTRAGHIITIEDPVEFIHQHRKSIVNQREVGDDTKSFKNALKHVLRQDPDIIMVGELRDLETISVALTAAETGHLVFATLHTQSAQETITRIIDVFPPEQQQQVQTQLAASLQGVVCQTLCKTADGNGRQAAVEIMVANPNVRALIREKKLQQIQGALQSGGKYGMQTLNQSLAELVKSGRITYEQGLEKCAEPDDFKNLVGGEDGARAAARKAEAAREASQGGFGGGMGSMGSGYAPPPIR